MSICRLSGSTLEWQCSTNIYIKTKVITGGTDHVKLWVKEIEDSSHVTAHFTLEG
jgi:hypothetical protein